MTLPKPSQPFMAKKQKILESLAVSPESYTDLSPKGSVDEGIRDLINEINSIDGLVTTSSCAGRISVFLEGQKNEPQQSLQEPDEQGSASERAVPGGKGLGGRWLFVSHDPVAVPEGDIGEDSVHDLFSLKAHQAGSMGNEEDGRYQRLARFQFEPMILHVMTASLPHASQVLSAAMNAGFRESGLQSLKSLHDPSAFPMVAVRSAGLGISSIVGTADGKNDSGDAIPHSIVSEQYLRLILKLGNERFEDNTARITRFRTELSKTIERSGKKNSGDFGDWEDSKARAQRKRAEGLARKEATRLANVQNETSKPQGPDNSILDGRGPLWPAEA